MSEELKPCPFCGSSDKLEYEGRWTKCDECGAQGPFLQGEYAWNRRTADARVERMEKVVEAAVLLRNKLAMDTGMRLFARRNGESVIPLLIRLVAGVDALAALAPEKAKCKNWKHHALCPDGCPPPEKAKSEVEGS